jgi:hypothetical protein
VSLEKCTILAGTGAGPVVLLFVQPAINPTREMQNITDIKYRETIKNDVMALLFGIQERIGHIVLPFEIKTLISDIHIVVKNTM